MNRLFAVCTITMIGGIALANGSTTRRMDAQEMDGVRGGCYIPTTLPCTGTTTSCNNLGCYTNTGGSYCQNQGLNSFTASGSYSDVVTGNGRMSTTSGGQIQCGTYVYCQTNCIQSGPNIVCKTGAPTPFFQSQTVLAGSGCSGS